MKIGKVDKNKVGKWQFEIGFIRAEEVLPKAWRFRIAILKVKEEIPLCSDIILKDYLLGFEWDSRIIFSPITHLKRFLNEKFREY